MRSRRALCTTTMIVALFTLFWLPYCVVEGTARLLGHAGEFYLSMEVQETSEVLYLLALFNSLVDPFVYALRMREVQRGQYSTVRFWNELEYSQTQITIAVANLL